MIDVNKKTTDVLEEVLAERERQDAKWGEQNHPDGTGLSDYRHDVTWFRNECDEATRAGTLTWDLILLEEVYEALAETDPARLRTELVQVAAVACGWVEALDRRTGPEVTP